LDLQKDLMHAGVHICSSTDATPPTGGGQKGLETIEKQLLTQQNETGKIIMKKNIKLDCRKL